MTVIACHKQLSPPSSFKPSEPSRLQTAGAIFLNLQMPEPAITPTYNGHIASTRDALIIIEACLTGRLNHIGRRPRESEEAILPSSGNIFVYESRSSGITSWQDGIQWSQAQRVGNLDLRLQSGSSATTSRTNGTHNDAGELCRRTISVTVRGITHHLVAYLTTSDLVSNGLPSPSRDPALTGVIPRAELVSQDYAAPIERDDRNDLLQILGT